MLSNRATIARFALAVVCLSPSACDKATERWSETVTAPRGPWKTARVAVRYAPRWTGAASSRAPSVSHTLLLAGDGGKEAHVTFVEVSERAPHFDELRETRYTLRFSPDAKMLGVSTDDGRTWTPVVMDAEQPYWCGHRPFAEDDAWPKARALALDTLAAVDPDSPGAEVHETASGDSPIILDWHYTGELEGAVREACAHPDDADLGAALVDAYVQPRLLNATLVVDRAEKCVVKLAGADAGARAKLAAAVKTLEGGQRKRVKDVLAKIDASSD